MAKNKTTENESSVLDYLTTIPDEKKRKDCSEIIEFIQTQTGFVPKMWGTGIVGFGSYHYKYESGREGDAPLVGLAARANAITLYIAFESEQKQALLQNFGKHKTGKGCIYIQKLEDIDTEVLNKLVTNAIDYRKRQYQS
ncbi:DUF1801 domain-containing protein [Spirosoma sp. HMF4905]|uniref:DUF1801 domain-containing protein n=1 Tax=Spirosoma arboris TaxID=2682092 RepID=A0A7K1S8C2_9BACT|nr:DUF1801 domain-containing protein [Spirosoma arboris]MVM30072.1 DUF1801 domain-containing protein [Spirosoma arboris]